MARLQFMNVNDVRQCSPARSAPPSPSPSPFPSPRPSSRDPYAYLHEFGKQLVTNATNAIYARARKRERARA